MADRGDQPERLTFFQRRALRELVKAARKRPGEPLDEHDWETYFRFGTHPASRGLHRVLRSLPSSPRCGYCGAPFAGLGGTIVKPLGYRPSRKNPHLCATCVELAPPGGTTIEAGVLFADLRGFTELSERVGPSSATALLRRFYACAEKTLFPEALIDKLIGDEVMALYVPPYVFPRDELTEVDDALRSRLATLMLAHARELLARVGYGTAGGPFTQVGVGLDFGEVYIGNIGDEAVHDFTAIGDPVNTASRLQGCAAGGEIVISERLARHLDPPPLNAEAIVVKGKADPVSAYRFAY
jgi:adenylate cyclase